MIIMIIRTTHTGGKLEGSVTEPWGPDSYQAGDDYDDYHDDDDYHNGDDSEELRRGREEAVRRIKGYHRHIDNCTAEMSEFSIF